MRSPNAPVTLAALVLLAGLAGAQSNDVPLNNGDDVFYTFSNPSLAGGLTSPPTGDMFWKVIPGDRVLNHRTDLGAMVAIDGYHELLFDTDWSTSPSFYDRAHGPAELGPLGVLRPAFFSQGATSEVLVQLGPSGFGNPCTIAPSLCSPSGGSCSPPGFQIGYSVDLSLGDTTGSGIVVPADGTTASDLATTYFVPGGMPTTGGLCGLGDYALQDSHSTDETMVGIAGNRNPYGGFVLGGTVMSEQKSQTATALITFRDPMLNVRADAGTGLGEEISKNGGGAMNALRLSVGAGQSALNVELRSNQHAGVPNVAVVGASLTGLVGASIPVLGAELLILPDGVFQATTSHWIGSVGPAVFLYTSEGAYVGTPIPVPALLAGNDVFLQGAVLDLGTGTADNTNAWRTSMLL